MDYRPLYRLRIEHDYFDQGECRALRCRICPSGAALWQRRGLLLRQFAVNEWAVLYDADGAGVDTASDVLELEMDLANPDFVLYTRWDGFRPYAAYILDLPDVEDLPEAIRMMREVAPKRGFGAGFCRLRLRLTDNVSRAAREGKPLLHTLRFHAPECRWEYLLVPRVGEDLAPGNYLLEEAGGHLHFPPFEPVRLYDRDLLRTVSEESVPMRERYAFKLKVVTSADGNGRKQTVLRHVDPPVPGRFLDTEPGLARQVCNL